MDFYILYIYGESSSFPAKYLKKCLFLFLLLDEQFVY